MESELSTFDRRIKILYLLFSGEQISRRELARRFSVSDTSINRDITALSKNIPIYSKMGRYGGIYIMDEFRAKKTYLSHDEENLLTEMLKVTTKQDKQIIQSILHKFSMPKVCQQVKTVN